MKYTQAKKGSEIFNFINQDTYDRFERMIEQLEIEAEALRSKGLSHPIEAYQLLKGKLHSILPELFYGIPTTPETNLHQTLWRCSNYDGIDISKTKSFSCPPVALTDYQRCNIPKHPVLYLSDNFCIAVSETLNPMKLINNPFWISEWEINHETPYILSPFISSECSTSNIFNEYLKSKFGEHPKSDFIHFSKIIDVLQKYFRRPKEYLISSFIAHSFIYDKTDLLPVMFVYNSILSKDRGLNFACHPSMVNSVLKLKTVIEMDFTPVRLKNELVLKYHIKRVGMPYGENIAWTSWEKLSGSEMTAISTRLFAGGTMETLS